MSCPKGNAETAVAGHALIPANYKEVVAALQRNYGNTDYLRRQLQFRLRQLHTSDNPQDLRHFLNNVERILRQMTYLGDPIEHPQIHLLIQEKLPRSVLVLLQQAAQKAQN